MLFLSSFSAVAALLLAQFLPGLFLAKLLDVGRDREERFVLAAVFAGPLSALFYLLTLLADWEPLYWILLVNSALLAVVVPWKTPRRFRGPRTAWIGLAATLAAVLVPYFLTTGSLYRPDADGNLLLDRALQRDVLFHVGVIRSLEHAYPPALLSVSGIPIGYHVGYHLQLAAWARFFGIGVMDGLIRLGTAWQLVLLVSSAFLLARRFTEGSLSRLATSALVLGSGLGFLFFWRPSVDWWSLAFMDVSLVSIFLANPFLPALPLLFAGLILLDDTTHASGRGALIGCVYCFVALLVVKVFVGAQILAALGVVALGDRRLRVPFVATFLAATPFLTHIFLAAESSNTSVGLRPLEIVRYSMEKLDWEPAVRALAGVGRFDFSGSAFVLGATMVWALGFLGPRLVGVRGWARDLRGGDSSLRRTMAWFAAIGFAVALVFRIAPAESEGLSRLQAQNDVVWFAAASGVLLWFWVADALHRRAALVVITTVALVSTAQHFFYDASLEPDRIGASRVRTARAAASLSTPRAIWLDPLDRSRPSLLPYVAGRAVVTDPYVGYDYMFVGKDEIDYRRHAIAQFWASSDPSFRAWILDHFDVDFVWQQGSELSPLRGLELVYSDGAEHLFRVHDRAFVLAPAIEMATPESIPMGNRGTPYLGARFRRSGRMRVLAPGPGRIYLPRAAARSLRLELRLDPRHGGGALVVEGRPVRVELAETLLEVELPPRDESGLDAIDVEWRGEQPLRFLEIVAR